MKAYGKRLLGYLCFGLALAWAVGPFSGKYKYEDPGPAVYLTSAAVLEAPAAARGLGALCREGPVKIGPATMAAFPEIEKTLNKLSSPPFEGGHVYLRHQSIPGFIRRVHSGRERIFCLAWRDRVFLVAKPYGLKSADFLLLGLPGRATADLPRVAPGNLADDLAVYDRSRDQKLAGLDLDRGALMSEAFEAVRTRLPVQDWRSLTRAKGKEWNAVVSGGRVFIGRIEDFAATMVEPLPGFDWWRYVLAGLFALFGLAAMRGRVGKLPGFKVSPGWAVRFSDVMFILAGSVGAFGFLESLMYAWFGVVPGLGNDISMQGVRWVTAWMWLPASAFFAFFTANLAGQSLEVTAEGITRHGPNGPVFAAWEDIESLEASDDYVPVGRVGLLMARKLQTRLVIRTGQRSFSLFEPSLKRTKTDIIAAINKYMPERLSGDLKRIKKDW